jgi:C4-dicarboxylate transporter
MSERIAGLGLMIMSIAGFAKYMDYSDDIYSGVQSVV